MKTEELLAKTLALLNILDDPYTRVNYEDAKVLQAELKRDIKIFLGV